MQVSRMIKTTTAIVIGFNNINDAVSICFLRKERALELWNYKASIMKFKVEC